MLNLAQPLDTSDPLLMGKDERREFMTPQERVVRYRARPPGETGYRGVGAKGIVFTACVYYRKKRIHIGTFATAKEAAHAYDAKARELHGEWAMLNFPDSEAA